MDYNAGLYISHQGILGMKWGVRRYQNEDGTLTAAGKKRYSGVETVSTKSGKTVTIAQKKQRYKKFSDDHDFDILADGKKVGDLFLEEHGDELYVNWIDVKQKERGKGYASAVMDYVISFGEKNGKSYATLEVPDDSPDARHIYEKKGFYVDTKRQSDEDWLTPMRKNLR